ncbi:hypothetical protein BDR05DRAFT_946554 [Suillus weaverae]|nr:hypothetical protein BDR05DRAFT_946554 [Suillus weaverae]
MSSQQIKEVNDVKEKWNKEGAPEESQANHKKRVDQTLSVTLSNGIKEWASTGFKFFAEWSKTELYPNGEDDDLKDEEDDNGLPEVILDDEGYAQLPSCDGIGLRGQQELVQSIFLASYKAFTHSCKPIPWGTITACKSQYLATGSILENFVHFGFLNALSSDENYLELVDAVKDLTAAMENLASRSWQEPYLPKYVHESKDMLMGCLKMLCDAPVVTTYSAILAVLGIRLVLRDCKCVIKYEEDEALPDTPSYLANSFMDLDCMIKLEGHHSHLLCTIVCLIEVAMQANFKKNGEDNDNEEDGKDKDDKDDKEDVEGKEDVKDKADKEDEEDEEDEEEGDKKEGVSDKVGNQESSQGDELQDAERNVDIQMQEVQKNDRWKPEAEPKGKKRTRAQVSSRQAKKARIEEEPICRSTRTRQPSKKVMQR